MTIEQLEVLITANTTNLKSELAKANSSILDLEKKVTSSTTKISNAFSMIKKAAVGLGIGAMLKKSIKSGLDYIAGDAVYLTTMQDWKDATRDFTEDLKAKLGISRSEMRRFMSVMYNITTSLGVASESSYKMSKSLSMLTQDMASFWNITTDEALSKLQSGLTGNVIALRQLGIVVNETMTKEEAYRMGLAKQGAELNEAQKTMARYNLIMKQSANMQGFLANTLNTPNAQLRMLKDSLRTLSQDFGQLFIPILKATLPYLNAFVKLMTQAVGVIAAFFRVPIGSKASEEMIKTSDAAGGVSSNLAGANKKAKELKKTLAGFDEMNVLNEDGSVGAMGGAGSGAIDVPLIEYDFSIFDNISSRADEIVDKLKGLFNSVDWTPLTNSLKNVYDALVPFGATIWDGLKWGYENLLKPLAKWTITELLPSFLNLTAGALRVLNPLLKGFMSVGKWLLEKFLIPIAKWTGGVVVSILNNLGKSLTNIGNWMSRNQSVVNAMTGVILAFFAAWKVTQLLAFIQMSGGTITVMKNMATALHGLTIAKLTDKAETIALTALYAKDFIVNLVKGAVEIGKQAAAWVTLTAAKLTANGASLAMIATSTAQAIATGAVTAATWLWNAALYANPIVAIVAGVAALVAGIILLVSWLNSASAEEKKFAAEMEKSKEAMEEKNNAYKDMQKNQQEVVNNGLAEMAYMEKLKNELKGLADEKGNVNEKDRARANFILNELNKAMDTEYQMVGNQIQGYNDLMTTTEKYIEQKKLQLLFEAREIEYKEAIIKETKAKNDMIKAEADLETARANLAQKNSKTNRAAYEDAMKAYQAARDTHERTSNDIMRYEDAMTASLEGNTKKAEQLLKMDMTNYMTRKDVAVLSMEEQNRIMKQQYNDAIKDLEDAQKLMNSKNNKENRQRVADAIDHANEMYKAYTGVGTNMVKGTEDGLKIKKKDLNNAVSDILGNGVVKQLEKELQINSPSKIFESIGKNMVTGAEQGVKNNKNSFISNIGGVFKDAVSSVQKVLGIKSPSKVFAAIGENTMEGYIQGIEGEADNTVNAFENIFKDVSRAAEYELADINDLPNTNINGTITHSIASKNDVLAEKIGELIDSDTPINLTVKIGEDTLINKIIDGINSKSFERNEGVFV